MPLSADRFLGVVLLVLTAPVLGLIALAVKLESRGPVFRRHLRADENGHRIETRSFRIYREADGSGALPTLTTAVGWFLWWTGLEELPVVLDLAVGRARIAAAHGDPGMPNIQITIAAPRPMRTPQAANVNAIKTANWAGADRRP